MHILYPAVIYAFFHFSAFIQSLCDSAQKCLVRPVVVQITGLEHPGMVLYRCLLKSADAAHPDRKPAETWKRG